ncbi:periostin, osteoblast specific factor b isoform X2 [Antennarius striatus]|uniref:periostin, osteoblast specific factor b isoform X2 n=1 Tax=Antennarius striatus TaxID=241820 RepID=UPI0035AECF22
MKLLFIVFFALFAFSAFDKADSSAYDKIVAHSRIRARKEGPNVCALQQVMGTKKKYFSTCRNWYRGSICGKKAMVLYECCPGYMKMEGMRGCPAVAPIDTVYGTLGLVKATSTQNYADLSELRPEIEGSGSFTLFAPSNDAWELLDEPMKRTLTSNVNKELYNALHYHMVNKRLLTKDLKNGKTFPSMDNDLGLLINHYSTGVVTVNCARIIHGNQVATNGVVHVIDRVISSVGTSIKDVLEADDDLTTLSDVAQSAGLLEKLGQPGQYTLFAPTNEAFERLGSEVMERLYSDKEVLKALLNFHLLDSVQCAEAIMAGSSYETLEGNNIEIGCDGESLTVNGIKMVKKKDIVTTNGVIHLIDQVLMPDSAKQVMELLGGSQSNFGDMVALLGLKSAMRPEAEYTLLAPQNTVFTDEVLTMDQRLLRFILESHILKNRYILEELYNGQKLETIGGRFLRVFIYRTAVCIENSCLIRGSKEGSNGALHLMRSLLKPAEKTMYEILTENGGYKIFLSLMEVAGLTDLLKQEGDFTLFAPSDKAFASMNKKDLALLMGDINALRAILLYHINNGIFIGGGLETGVTNLLKSLQGSNIRVMSANNTMLVNSVQALESDIMATNGVIHFIEHVLYPQDIPVGSQELYMLLRRLITYMQFKYIPGFRYQEIPLTFLKRIITHVVQEVPETKVTKVIQEEPTISKVTRIVQGDPSISKVTRIVQGDPSISKVTRIVQGDPSISKVTRIVQGDPSFSEFTKVIEGDPTLTEFTKVIEGEPSITKVTRIVQGDPSISKVTRIVQGDPSFSEFTKLIEGDPTLTEFTKVIEGEPSITKVTRIVQGDPSISKVTRIIQGDPSLTEFTKVIEGDPSLTEFTKVIEGEPSFTKVTRIVQGDPSFTKVTRVIEGDPSLTEFTKVIESEPKITRIIEGDPTFTRIIEGDPTFTTVTKVIQGEPKITKILEGDPTFTRIIEGDPTFTTLTRVIEVDPSFTTLSKDIESDPSFTKVTRVIQSEPKVARIVSGPQFSVGTGTTNINVEDVNIAENPSFASDRLTKIIQAGNRRRGRN